MFLLGVEPRDVHSNMGTGMQLLTRGKHPPVPPCPLWFVPPGYIEWLLGRLHLAEWVHMAQRNHLNHEVGGKSFPKHAFQRRCSCIFNAVFLLSHKTVMEQSMQHIVAITKKRNTAFRKHFWISLYNSSGSIPVSSVQKTAQSFVHMVTSSRV